MPLQSSLAAGSTDSGTLVERLKTGDSRAWRRFTAIYGPLVFSWARRAGLQDADAADVTQQVCQAVAERIAEFRHGGQGQTFRGWLRVITRYKVVGEFRRREARPGLAEDHVLEQFAALDAPSAAELSGELAALSHRALTLLRGEFQPATWQAFEQLVLESRSAEDVAASLGLSRASVYTAKCRVLARLRQELGDIL